MTGLMYKNFLLYRIELILIAVIQLFISATVLFMGITDTGTPQGTLLLYAAMFLMTGFFESGLFSADESRATRSFLIAAPTGAAGHIRSKYDFVLLVNLAVLCCCFLTEAAVFALTGNKDAMTGLLLMCSVSLINEALTLPFVVYFGANYGVGVKSSVLGVIVLLALLYALFGDITYFLSNDFMTALGKLFQDENVRLMLRALPYIAALLYWLSCKLSVVLFRKATENDD